MRYLEAKPQVGLREWVKCYWFFEKEYPAHTGEMILPDSCLDLIFSAGQSLMIGPMTKAISLPASGKTQTVGIRFYPYGLAPFLRYPLDELTNQTVEGNLLFGKVASEISQQITDCEPKSAFTLMEQFLLAQRQTLTDDVGIVKDSLRWLSQTDTPIRDIAGHMHLSTRVVERKFKQITGFSPKTLARVLRFNRLKNDLMLNPSQNLTRLAHQYCYFDQAHFSHDFRKFTGQTPSQFIQHVQAGAIRFYR